MKPIFVGGCYRSGTTILGALLGGHSATTTPPESQFLVDGLATCSTRSASPAAANFVEAIRGHWRLRLWDLPDLDRRLDDLKDVEGPAEVMAGLAREYALARGEAGATYWVDHTPDNIGYFPTLAGLFPDAQLIHIVRDPRAVIASILPLDWGPSTPRQAARLWLARLGMGLATESHFGDRVTRVRFEDLVRTPTAVLAGIAERLNLEFEPGMLDPTDRHLPAYTVKQHALVGQALDPTRAAAWKRVLSPEDVRVIEGELKDVLLMLGYEPVGPTPATSDVSSVGEVVRGNLIAIRQRVALRKRVRRALRAPSTDA
jgi:hypothetical protein